MRTTIVAFLLIGTTALVKGKSTIYEQIYSQIVDECREQNSYTEQDVAEVINLEKEISYAAQCLTACADTIYGLMKDGKYGAYNDTLQLLQELFADDPQTLSHLPETIDKCYAKASVEKPDDQCAAANYVVHCFVETTGYM